MRNEKLICIFNFFDQSKLRKFIKNNDKINTPGFYIVHLFSEYEMIQLKQIEKIISAKQVITNGEINLVGPFDSLDELNQTAYQICEQRNAISVNIISLENFNSSVVSVMKRTELIDSLCQMGEVFKNVNSDLKQGIFDKFFN